MAMIGSTASEALREQVRGRYAAAARTVTSGQGHAVCCGDGGTCCTSGAETETGASASCCGPTVLEDDDTFGSALYVAADRASLPVAAVAASLGCGNPLAVAELREGETVLDLGSGGGIDVLLSAKRVGPSGFAYGVDMTDEMLELAQSNAAKAGATNVEFVKGTIEDVPLPAGSVDVVISNCVINLSVDKPKVLAEIFRVLRPGGRIGISDVVAEDDLTPAERADRGSYVGCIAGALSRAEYLEGLAAAGFVDVSVRFAHQAADGMHSAIVQATKPITTSAAQATPSMPAAALDD
jgi:arsenite methyltransferase